MARIEQLDLFNDIMGPIMIGPSSSHTAGPVRIGRLCRHLLGEQPVEAEVIFDPAGSFAATYRGHGSDLGFTAGLLGWADDDERVAEALLHAEQAGLKMRFRVEPLPDARHPNQVVLRLRGADGTQREVQAVSLGGGMIRVECVDGMPVSLQGAHHELLVRGPASASAGLAGVQRWLEQHHFQPFSQESAHENGAVQFEFKLSRPMTMDDVGSVLDLPAVEWAAYLPPITPVASIGQSTLLFDSVESWLSYADTQSISPGMALLRWEAQRAGMSLDDTRRQMRRTVRVLRAVIQRSLSTNLDDRLVLYVRQHAPAYLAEERAGRLIPAGWLNVATAYATAILEHSAAHGLTCAIPTAGSAGVVPGALLACAESLGLNDSAPAVLDAFFAAGGVGLFIAKDATFGAEEGGCQAEVGSAAAMAAAGLVALMGGSPAQMERAAAFALQNLMGLVCDPVGGAAEIPCITRNAIGVANALSAANLALGGFDPLIPLSQTIAAQREVGHLLCPALRCTGRGGSAATPAARRLVREAAQQRSR